VRRGSNRLPENTAGQAVALSDRATHNEGATAAGPLNLIAIYIVEKGQPLVQPVK